MVRFLQSSIRFIGRVVKRAWAGAVWWLLDVTELYSRYVVPRLPPEWAAWLAPYANYLDAATPWVISAVLLGAILYTYYEAERLVLRDPKIPQKLREFYVRSNPFTRYDLKSEGEFPAWKDRAHQWHTEVQNWIRENMGEAALIRFQETPLRTMGSMHVKHAAAVNGEHDQLVRAVKISRGNLQSLIENGAWDAKERKERRWRPANIFRWKKRGAASD